MKVNKNIQKYFLPLLVVVAIAIILLKPASDNLLTTSLKIQNQLNSTETTIENAARNTVLREVLESGRERAAVIEELEARNIFMFFYRGDTLTHWTNNSVSPVGSPASIEEGTSFHKYKNGWYQVTKYTDTTHHEIFVGLAAVKYEYPFENKFLKNDFAFSFHLPNGFNLSIPPMEGAAPIKNLSGETLFYLYSSGDNNEINANLLLLISQLIILLVGAYYLHTIAVFLTVSRNFIIGFSFLAIAILSIRGAMLWLNQPSEFYKLNLFDPKFYASSVVTKSLGDLIINSLAIVWLVLFHAKYSPPLSEKNKVPKFFKLQNIALVFAYTGLVWWVFKTLVMDSIISFEVYNLLSLNLYSLLGILCITLLLICHFILSRNIILHLHQAAIKPYHVVTFTLVVATLFIVASLSSFYVESLFYSTLWCVGFVIVSYLLLQKNNGFSIRNLMIYVAIYSVLSTFLIENLYEKKERNNRRFFSSKLVSERDFIAEFMFTDIRNRIQQDNFIKKFFSNPLIPKKEIYDRINSLYLGGYFNKYNLRLLSFNATGQGIQNEDTTNIQYYIHLIGKDSASPILHYIADTSLNYTYLSVIPFADDSVQGELVLRLSPKTYFGQNVYPELLLGSHVQISNNLSYYAYAIYQNNKLIAQSGDFPYSYYWNKDYRFDPNSDVKFIEETDWEHNIQRFANGKRVIVSVKREPLFEPIATFSYFFTFFFGSTLVLYFLLRAFSADRAYEYFSQVFPVSFRTRINYSMLVMIIVSFVVIGIITISFFSRQYDDFYTDRLMRKEKAIHSSLEYFIQKNNIGDNLLHELFNNELSFEVARLADINSIDINLFDKNGDLAVSSQPAIYEKGLVSKKINPDAYFEMKNQLSSQITEQEQIGALKYMATYAPVRNALGETVAYIGIPYFERSKNISDDVSSFLVALMNVYMFLLICAAILAYFVSNSITHPLTIISNKLRSLNLSKTNEPIEWNSKDEIGNLVAEYNKMIAELEQSAQKLAKGERESAWREMAKQIAHEIKNPLTPMKLSIQYLQRAIDEGNPNINQLAKKVTKTLEEQIENLSSIATAFSSFAKMPKPQNEIINLNDLLKSISDLFTREENVTVTFTTEAESPLVFADKNQLVSVFNNLVKNATQSIPEQRKGFVDVHIKEEDGWLNVVVSDNGSGIPKENYDKVFVPNFTTKSSGTGLGLAIAKQIIESTGGNIWFETAENVGTAFFIRLKKYRQP